MWILGRWLGTLLLICVGLSLQSQSLSRFPETFPFKVEPNGGLWQFQVWVDENNSIRRVKVIDASGHLAQTIIYGEGSMEPGVKLDLKDFNFDGFLDLTVRSMYGATGNRVYEVYLFDPKVRRFRRSAALSKLGNPEPHPDTRSIWAHWNGGLAGCIHGLERYEWRGRRLVEVWKEDQDEHTKTTWERRNGKLVKVRTEKSDCEQ